jgi:hypothetical protein
MCHRGTITIPLKNNIIYVYVKGFTLTFTLLRRGRPCVHAETSSLMTSRRWGVQTG